MVSCQLFKRCGANLDRLWKFCCERLKDVLSFVFVGSLTLTTYVYGMIWVIPALSARYELPAQCLMLMIPTWILYGILGNVYYIRKRNSFALKLLPVPFQPADQEIIERTSGSGYARYAPGLTGLPIMDQAAAYGEENPSANALLKRDNFGPTPLFRPAQISFALDPTEWHSCGVCRIKVPPRTWHCGYCKNCVLRRDHHCTFAMSCVGEENQANFIGFLLYMSIGAFYGFFLGALYRQQLNDLPLWLTFVTSMLLWYPLIFDFGFHNILTSLLLLMGFTTFGFFVNYVYLASKGRTSYDSKKKISRLSNIQTLSWNGRVKEFLGSYPFLRILIPCFPTRKITYEYTNSPNCGTQPVPNSNKNIDDYLNNGYMMNHYTLGNRLD